MNNNFLLVTNSLKEIPTSKNDCIDTRNYAYQAYLDYLVNKHCHNDEEEMLKMFTLKHILNSHYGNSIL